MSHPLGLVEEVVHHAVGHGGFGAGQIGHGGHLESLGLPLHGSACGEVGHALAQRAGHGLQGHDVAGRLHGAWGQTQAVARFLDAFFFQQPDDDFVEAVEFVGERTGEVAQHQIARFGRLAQLLNHFHERAAQHFGPHGVEVGAHHGQTQGGTHQRVQPGEPLFHHGQHGLLQAGGFHKLRNLCFGHERD